MLSALRSLGDSSGITFGVVALNQMIRAFRLADESEEETVTLVNGWRCAEAVRHQLEMPATLNALD